MTQTNQQSGMRTFITIWFGQLVSTLGSGLTGWGLGVLVYQRTDSITLFVINLVCYILPTVVFAPLAGVVADRKDRRWVLILADIGAGIGTVTILLALQFGTLQIWHVYLVTAIAATANTFQWPAYSAATTMLVPKAQLGRSGGMVQIGEALSQLVTPAVAGVLYVSVGMKSIVMIDLATLFIAIGTLLICRIPTPESRDNANQTKGTLWEDMSFGWRYLVNRPGLLGLLIYFAIGNFFASIPYALLTPMLLDMTTPDMLGFVGSVGGMGMLAGTLVMSIWGGLRQHRVLSILVSDMVGALATIMIGFKPWIPLIATGMFIVLFTLPIGNGNSQALWQSKVAPDVQGRVFSIRRMIAYSIMPVSFLVAGFLAESVFEPLFMVGGKLAGSLGVVIGSGPGRGTGFLFILGGLMWGTAAAATMFYPRVRKLEIEIPDAVS